MTLPLFDEQTTDAGRSGVATARAILAGDVEAARTMSIRERDEGMERAAAGAGEWTEEAFAFVRSYLETHEELFCDDLWVAGLTEPPNAKALGPVFLRAVREGLMRKSGAYRPSVSSHRIPKPVWTSLIYKGAPTP